MISKVMQYFSLSFFCLTLVGCDLLGSTSDLEDWMSKNPEDVRARVEPLPEVEPYTPFIYQASNLVDPFSPKKLESTRGSMRPGADRPRQALEAYDLENLAMTGTIFQNGVIFALIKTPKGDIYQVTSGNYLGKNEGKIIKITEGEVELSETVPDVNGEWIQRAATLQLAESNQ